MAKPTLIHTFEDVRPRQAGTTFEDHRLMWPVINKESVGAEQFRVSIWCSPKGACGPMHSHDTDEMFFILAGEVVIVTDSDSYKMKKNDFMYFPAGIMHQAQNRGNEDAWLLCVVSGCPTKTTQKGKA